MFTTLTSPTLYSNKYYTFDFGSETAYQYLMGVTAFNLTHQGTDKTLALEQASISIRVIGRTANSITIMPVMTFQCAPNDTDGYKSSVVVTILAVTQSGVDFQLNSALAQENDIPVAFDTSNLSGYQNSSNDLAVISSGFIFNGTKSPMVDSVQVSASLANGSNNQVLPTATISSGLDGFVDVGFIYGNGLSITPTGGLQGGTVPIPPGFPSGNIAVFMTDFKIVSDNEGNPYYINGNLSVNEDKNNVSGSVGMELHNYNQNYWQDNNKSYMSGVILQWE